MHKALGRGLEALLTPSRTVEGPPNRVTMVSVDKIRPNKHQPRVHFSEESLESLAASLKTHGVAQPLLVSPSAVPGEFELVAGERRLRAAKKAGLREVPCAVRNVTERERHELALVENIQREDLNPLEEAESLRKLMDAFAVTQEDMARALGRSRSAVANKLRLLDLPEEFKAALRAGRLTEGHARALLGISDPTQRLEAGRRILVENLTVRDVENLGANRYSSRKSSPRAEKDADARRWEEELQKDLSRKVELQIRGKNKGWVRLAFYSFEDLDVLVRTLKGRKP